MTKTELLEKRIEKQEELIAVYEKDLRKQGLKYPDDYDTLLGKKVIKLKSDLSALKAMEESKGTKITIEQEEFKDIVLKERDKDNVVYAGVEVYESIPLDDIIKQPVDGLLYDLNRNESVVL
jgi:hypothetical protein